MTRKVRLFDARNGRLIQELSPQGGFVWAGQVRPRRPNVFQREGAALTSGGGNIGIPEGADRSVHVWRYAADAP